MARLGVIGLLAFRASLAPAPETDNFYLPLDTDMADLGPYLEAVHTLALEKAVNTLNSRIETALSIKDETLRAKLLERCHNPDTLAAAFIDQFSHSYFEATMVEHALKSKVARTSFPGQLTLQKNVWLNFSAHLPLEPRQILMLAQCATVQAYDVYFGTDKLVHFHSVGWSYYRAYRSHLKTGCSPEEAVRKVVHRYSRADLLAETTLFGKIATGIYSNADLAANLAGLKFFLNLTEPVVLKDKVLAPLVIRCGEFWQLNQHVRPRSGWFASFVSDHWNEALNPSLYEFTMRPGIRRVLHSRAKHIIEFYTVKDGRPNDPAYFDILARELSTYYGEPYGHSGDFHLLMNIGNTCYPESPGTSQGLVAGPANNK
ncbi:MAG TPA: hypothetical protein VFZ59_04720 [Verrucomicrobiae bacterium]|nr:hypothetical protein [Verrucomicrobiae bacterium]